MCRGMPGPSGRIQSSGHDESSYSMKGGEGIEKAYGYAGQRNGFGGSSYTIGGGHT